jgi:myosin heavy subunit
LAAAKTSALTDPTVGKTAKLQGEITALRSTNQSLKAEIINLRAQLAVRESSSREIADLRLKNATLQRENERLLSRNIESSDELRRENAQTRSELAESMERNSKLTSQLRDQANLTKQVEQLTEQNEALKGELQTYSSMVEELSGGSTSALGITDGSPDRLRQLHDYVVEENVKLRKKLRESPNGSIEEVQAENERLKQQLEELQKERDQFRNVKQPIEEEEEEVNEKETVHTTNEEETTLSGSDGAAVPDTDTNDSLGS